MPDSHRLLSIIATMRTRRVVFATAMAVVLVLAMLPPSVDLPTTGWDKTNHMLGFSILALLGSWSYPGRSTTVMAGLLAYGGLIEVLQSFTGYRSAEWGDLLADTMGLSMGWALGEVARTVARHRGNP